jgi:hypothetical protein
MKKSHPDEDKIPTLRDLVFPGNQELRRSQSHERERIEPQLTSGDELESEDASSPKLDDSYSADPFILLPDEDEQDWKPAASPEQASREPAEPPYADFPAADSDTPEADEVAQYGDIAEQQPELPANNAMTFAPEHGGMNENEADAPSTATSNIPSGIEVEEEVSIEDLMTYFQNPKPPSKAIFETLQAPAAIAPADMPSATTPDAETAAEAEPPLEETIRATVRTTLEQELDRLTDIVTDAVITRLRK